MGDQVLIYDDGVGTGRFKPIVLLGNAIGFGLSKNVRDLYTFLCRNYQAGDANTPADKVFIFGFSRGAFTVRVLIGLIHSQGLVQAKTEEELRRKVRAGFKAYRAGYKTNIQRWWAKLRSKPERPRGVHATAPKIAFLGVWDTVDAYGLPVEELKKGYYYWFKSWSFPDRLLTQIVERVCHVLALDDERRTFHPLLWDEAREPERAKRHGFDPNRLTQVWFPGVHSNVGGGYPKDGLSYISLGWMMREAEFCGLRFCPGSVAEVHRLADWNAELYDSRSGLASYYRYAPRDLSALCSDTYHKVGATPPKIHESTFRRIKDGVVSYAPSGIPADYEVVYADGQIVPGDQDPSNGSRFEDRTQSVKRAIDQEAARDSIWWRRIVYLATVAVSLYLAIFPVLHPAAEHGACVGSLCLLDPALAAIQGFLPDWAVPWLNSFRQTINYFVVGIILLGLLMWRSVVLRRRINERQERCWGHLVGGPVPTTALGKAPRSFAYWVRNCRPLVAFYRWLARSALPFAFAIAIFLGALFVLNKIAVETVSSFGLLCDASSGATTVVGEAPKSIVFDTRMLCQPTRLRLEQGNTYEVIVTPSGRWSDGGLEASVDGLVKRADIRKLAFAVPMRRSWGEAWFRPIARIGATGRDEYALGAKPTRFVAGSSGELFLFVNDAVIFLASNHFYNNNHGTAKVTVKRVQSTPE